MKVIGAGYGRTGTLSLQKALNEVGVGPCYHMFEVEKKNHLDFWLGVTVNPSAVSWDTLFKHDYQSCVDFPACRFYKELMRTYPEAVVVLTIRDPEEWYNSSKKSIYRLCHLGWGPATLFYRNKLMEMVFRTVWNGTFQGHFANKELAIQNYCDHIKEVKATVPPEKLLIFSVEQGWTPLCKFLRVPVPETPFPHLNNSKTMSSRIETVRLKFLLYNFLIFLLVGFSVAFLLFFLLSL